MHHDGIQTVQYILYTISQEDVYGYSINMQKSFVTRQHEYQWMDGWMDDRIQIASGAAQPMLTLGERANDILNDFAQIRFLMEFI